VSRTSLSPQKVNCVDVAAGGNLLASCGNDRTVRVWDLRAMRDDSPLHSFTHGYSVNSVYFSPSGSLLLSTSIDDYLRVWPAASPDPSSWSDCARIRHNNHTGRWVTLFKARWTMTDDAFIVGNMQRQVDVYGWENAAAGGWSGGRQAGGVRQPDHSGLTSAELTAIPSVIAVHPTNSCFMAATASSYAYVFA
jgi:WD40 repeat protein